MSTPRYETRDARPAPLVLFIAGLALLTAVVALVASGLLRAFAPDDESERTHPMGTFRERPNEPLLQATSTTEVRALRAWEDDILGQHAWVDRTNGIVRIPLERAMMLVSEGGLPQLEVVAVEGER